MRPPNEALVKQAGRKVVWKGGVGTCCAGEQSQTALSLTNRIISSSSDNESDGNTDNDDNEPPNVGCGHPNHD